MDKHEISQETERILGLTKAEKKIFEAISNIGKQISTIARITNIPRTSLLYILKALQKRKLVEPVKKGKYTFWKSNTINALRIIKNVKSDIKIYKGVNEMLEIFDKLTALPIHSRIYGMQPDNSIKFALKKVSTEKWSKINSILKQKKLIFEGVVHEKSVDTVMAEMSKEGALSIYDSFIGRLEDYVKIPDDFADVRSEIYIFGGSAYIINWDKEVALEINDESIVALLLAMFSCVKQLGQRYSQNKKMEIYKQAIRKKNNPTPPNTPQ